MSTSNMKLGLVVLVSFAFVGMALEKRWPFRKSAGPHVEIRRHVNWWFTWLFIATGAPLLLVRKCALPDVQGSELRDMLRDNPWLHALVAVLMVDFAAYLAHYLMHKTRIGWSFHRVHHADSHVDFSTSFRQHPTETVWRFVFQSVAFMFVAMPAKERATLALAVALHSQLHHLNLNYPTWIDRALGWIFVTPRWHRIHHSREVQETDTNYGTIFSFWDRLFGTLHWTDVKAIRYGLDEFDHPDTQRFLFLLNHRAIDRKLKSQVEQQGLVVESLAVVGGASEAPKFSSSSS